MLFDPIRNCFVPALPEEKIRQRLISFMIGPLGFPKSYLSVEKDIKSLPHMENREFISNKRRIDLLCFANGIHSEYELYPLVIIECKAIPLSEQVVAQVLGYNHYVQAPFCAIVNAFEIKTFWKDRGTDKIQIVNFLPSYKELVEKSKV